jgi:hypothetical protein
MLVITSPARPSETGRKRERERETERKGRKAPL